MAKKDDDRARRLAAALRENLKRRKAQAREKVTEGAPDKSHPGEACPERLPCRQSKGPGPMNTGD